MHLYFAENNISDQALLLLSQEDLKAMVPALGDRVILWDAISKLKAGGVYVCSVCSGNFQGFKSLIKHLTIDHSLSHSDNYKCFHCNSLFKRKSFLKHCRNIFKFHKYLLGRDVTSEQCHNNIEICDNFSDSGKHFQNIDSLENTCQPENDKIINFDTIISQLLAVILQSGKIPITTCDLIIDKVKLLVKNIRNLIESEFYSNQGVRRDNILRKIDDVVKKFAKFDTKYKLDKFLIDNKLMIPAEEISLDSNISFRYPKKTSQSATNLQTNFIIICTN